MDKRRRKAPDVVRRAFEDRSILNASRHDVGEFLVANEEYRILDAANRDRASEMGETMRQLLAARQSQELHGRATRIAVIAPLVSIAALAVAVARLLVASTHK
jgi:hypothetical protein